MKMMIFYIFSSLNRRLTAERTWMSHTVNGYIYNVLLAAKHETRKLCCPISLSRVSFHSPHHIFQFGFISSNRSFMLTFCSWFHVFYKFIHDSILFYLFNLFASSYFVQGGTMPGTRPSWVTRNMTSIFYQAVSSIHSVHQSYIGKWLLSHFYYSCSRFLRAATSSPTTPRCWILINRVLISWQDNSPRASSWTFINLFI